MKNEYIINKETLYFYPIDNKNVKVYENGDDFIVTNSVKRILDDSCINFGSTFGGRLGCTKKIINISSKLPVVVEEANDVIFFPTLSIRNSFCHWISFNNIKSFHKISYDCTRIIFRNNVVLDLMVSFKIIENQFSKCSRLFYELNVRKKAIL